MADEPHGPATWDSQLARAERTLADAGRSAPRQDAAELLAHVLGVPVPLLLARPDTPMLPSDARAYEGMVARRAAGEALPHITGHLAFMGLDIAVAPRGPLVAPGAQRLVETALRWARAHAPGDLLAVEVGTGCGAIALALAVLEPRFARVYALDPSPAALESARANGARYLMNLVITWNVGAGLDAVPEPVDLIVCGLPGHLDQTEAKLRPGGALIAAVAEGQRAAVAGLLTRLFAAAPAWVEAHGDGPGVVVAQRAPVADGG